MQSDRITVKDESPGTPAERRALASFADALHALSDDPGPASVARYLEASRALAELQRATGTV
jgi:hypothetical protein